MKEYDWGRGFDLCNYRIIAVLGHPKSDRVLWSSLKMVSRLVERRPDRFVRMTERASGHGGWEPGRSRREHLQSVNAPANRG